MKGLLPIEGSNFADQAAVQAKEHEQKTFKTFEKLFTSITKRSFNKFLTCGNLSMLKLCFCKVPVQARLMTSFGALRGVLGRAR